MSDTIKRARWQRNGPASWVLLGNGVVLAYIQGGRTMGTDYGWTAHTGPDNRTGSHISLYGAQRAARKALREAGNAANSEAG